jgi:rubrerythrin
MAHIKTPAELYAHAIAIEREAAARYGELAERMSDEGREPLALIFGFLAQQEAEHLDALLRRTEGVALPQIDEGRYHWIDTGAPETAAHDLVMRLLSPRQALAIALQAEQRAQAFFEQAVWLADDPALRALAREMAAEEQEHAAMIGLLLESTPEPRLDSTVIFQR